MSRPARIAAQDLLSNSDPLSDAACRSLIYYGEEDDLVDFKESFDPGTSSRSWIELAVDCAALANTHGGYLVFGVRDKTWELVGLQSETALALSDIKKVLEKVNRGLMPAITAAGARRFEEDDKEFVILAVPPSHAFTHIFESEVTWKNPKGETILGVRQGTIYMRRSGSNAIVTSADFEQLIERRLKHFREKVLEGLARVVNAAPGHEVLTVALAPQSASAMAVTVVDAPAALELSGKALTLKTDSISDRINLLIALTRAQPDTEFDARFLYDLYSVREDTALNDEQKAWVIHHSLKAEVPAFYWLQQVKDAVARELILGAFESSKFWRRVSILNYAAFYGERFHKKLYERLGAGATNYNVRQFRTQSAVFNVERSRQPDAHAARATELARALAAHHDVQIRAELERLDCSLYAPFD